MPLCKFDKIISMSDNELLTISPYIYFSIPFEIYGGPYEIVSTNINTTIPFILDIS